MASMSARAALASSVILAVIVAVVSPCAADPGDATAEQATAPTTAGTQHVTVTASPLREERLIGANQQPEWTAVRRFSETRVYVLPPWTWALDLNWQMTKPREEEEHRSEGEGEDKGDDLQHQLTQEIELGLPYRLQLDGELTGGTDPEEENEWRFLSGSIELRYALAQWDAIPLNPTLFGEWKFRNAEADSYELRLLLGDEVSPAWHYGVDFFFENQVGDKHEREFAISSAVSYSVIDQVLGVGIEAKFSAEHENEPRDEEHPGDEARVARANDDEGDGEGEGEPGEHDGEEEEDYKYRFEIGPSLQWRPFEHFHVDLVPLFGVTDESPVIESFVIVGFDLGGPEQEEISEPASMRNK